MKNFGRNIVNTISGLALVGTLIGCDCKKTVDDSKNKVNKTLSYSKRKKTYIKKEPECEIRDVAHVEYIFKTGEEKRKVEDKYGIYCLPSMLANKPSDYENDPCYEKQIVIEEKLVCN